MLVPSVTADSLVKLAGTVGTSWRNIEAARKATHEIEQELIPEFSPLASDDVSIVVFGSFARREKTAKSDFDWTLLIDGQASSDHLTLATKLQDRIEDLAQGLGFEPPKKGGAFGVVAFSHDIIHHIGGQDDSNQNMTRRILLLLESRVLCSDDQDAAYRRVVTAVLNRYLEEEANHNDDEGKRFKVPRFLLNDIVRFWRTMAVDFASKQRDRGGKGWGLRNAKLQFSRKLIFAAGLLMCFSCSMEIAPPDRERSPDHMRALLVDFLKKFVWVTPLDILADALMRYSVAKDCVLTLMNSYDAFLGILNDEEKRKHLEHLRAEESRTDALFQEVRTLSRQFQSGLDAVFSASDSHLTSLTKKYGIF